MPLTRIKSTAIGVDAITSARIDDGAVDTVDLADGSVTSAKLDTNLNVDIDSGTIDGVTIGGASAGAGTFTTLTATGTTTLAGATTSADITFGDNDKTIFGAGSDLQIYHNGSNSYIQEIGTGNLFVASDANVNITNQATTELKATFISNGAVNLYHDNSLKLATTSTGIDVTGTVTADGLTVDGNAQINSNTDGTPALTLKANNNGLTRENTLRFYDDDGAADNGQQVGRIEFYTDDNTNTGVNAYIEVTNNTTGYGTMHFGTGTSATLAERMTLASGGLLTNQVGAVFNESGADSDFRVESDSNTHMLFVDAGNNRVGINQSSPNSTLDVSGSFRATAMNSSTASGSFSVGSSCFISGLSSAEGAMYMVMGTLNFSPTSNRRVFGILQGRPSNTMSYSEIVNTGSISITTSVGSVTCTSTSGSPAIVRLSVIRMN